MATYLKSRTDGSVQSTSAVLGSFDEEKKYIPFDDGDRYEITEQEFKETIAAIPKPIAEKSDLQKLLEWAKANGHI